MWWTSERANAVSGGIWLIGLGVLFATRCWFPGVLFLAGATVMIQGSARGDAGRAPFRGGVCLVLIGFWAMTRFNLTALFVGLGVYVIMAALMRPNHFHKPFVDRTLE